MKKLIKFCVYAVLVFCALCCIMLSGLYAVIASDLFVKLDTDLLHDYPQTGYLYDLDDALIATIYTENRTNVAIDTLPKHVIDAFIAAEDIRFYQHNGLDIRRIPGALAANLRSGSPSQGASTITQQLIKLTHLTNEKTLSRKLKEMILSLKLERVYDKNEILECYLNRVYFGHGAYGIQAAATTYYGCDAAKLTLAQAASLAAILKAPTNYAPHLQPEKNMIRRNYILDTMAEEGMITAAQAENAKASPPYLFFSNTREPDYGWYLDAALEEAANVLEVDYEALSTMGLHLYTSLDRAAQNICNDLYRTAEYFPEDAADGTPCQSAFVLIDSRTGQVLSLIGGREYEVRRGFNRAVDAMLQPGSILKPLAVYIPALERHIVTAATVTDDQETDFSGYSPHNYGDRYYGLVTLRESVARSLNIAPVSLLNIMGVQAGTDSLRRFHIDVRQDDSGLSLAVGSMKHGVTPLEICAAYASLSAQGIYHEPTFLRRIEDARGNILYESSLSGERVTDPAVAFLMTDLLTSAVDYGTAKTLSQANIPLAAKTGTVGYDEDQNRAVWSVAYTPSLTMICWMGFDRTDEEHALPDTATGGKQPSELLCAFLERLQPAHSEFVPPQSGLVTASIDRLSLELPGEPMLAGPYTLQENIVTEWFLEGTQPTIISDLSVPPDTPQDFCIEKGADGYPQLSFTILDEQVCYQVVRVHNGQAHIIALISGKAGERITYTDRGVFRLDTYSYYILPDNRKTGIRGTATDSVPYTVPLPDVLLPWWQG